MNPDGTPPQLSVALDETYLPDVPGVHSVHKGILSVRDTIAAHTDLEYRSAHIRRREIEGQDWGVQTAVVVPDMGDQNLRNIARVADALHTKTIMAVGELVMQHFPDLPVDAWMILSPDGVLSIERPGASLTRRE